MDKEKLNSFKKSMKDFIEILIEKKYKKITELIVESELLDISKIEQFLINEKNKNDIVSLTNDIQKNIIL